MRDILVTVVLLGLVPFSLRRPIFAASVYIAISIGSVYRLAFGFASDQPWAMLYVAILLVALFFSKDHSVWSGVVRWLPFFPFLLWVTLSTIVALDTAIALDRYLEFIKIQIGLMLVFAAIRTLKDLILIYFVYVASISFHGVKSALFFIMSNSAVSIHGPPASVIADNNYFSVALVSCIPLLIYFASRVRSSFLSSVSWGLAGANGLTALATMSRGGMLALSATVLFILIGSKKRIKIFIIVLPMLYLVLNALPQEFYDRMSTIERYDEDMSVKGRFDAWETASNVAKIRVTGAGFEFYKNAEVWARFSPEGSVARAAHSIYFQLLGDHGVIGLLFYLGAIAWVILHSTLRLSASSSAFYRDFVDLKRAGLLSILSILIGGASLSFAYWEGFLLLIGLISCLRFVYDSNYNNLSKVVDNRFTTP